MKIRVLRLLEYEYETVERMTADMEKWQVPASGIHSFGQRVGQHAGTLIIRSAVVLPHGFDENAQFPTKTTPRTNTYIRATHPDGFRAGQWARIVDEGVMQSRPGCDVYLVEFPDKEIAIWPVHDDSDPYEFSDDRPD